MKRIIASKPDVILCCFSSVLFFVFAMMALWAGIGEAAGESIICFLLFGFCLFFSCFLIWYMNRAACVIWVEDGIIKCKGLMWGFYKECSVRSLRKVKMKYERRALGVDNFIYLVNDTTEEYKKLFRIRKDSYIAFRETKKNLAFLQTFWSGDIEK